MENSLEAALCRRDRKALILTTQTGGIPFRFFGEKWRHVCPPCQVRVEKLIMPVVRGLVAVEPDGHLYLASRTILDTLEEKWGHPFSPWDLRQLLAPAAPKTRNMEGKARRGYRLTELLERLDIRQALPSL